MALINKTVINQSSHHTMQAQYLNNLTSPKHFHCFKRVYIAVELNITHLCIILCIIFAQDLCSGITACVSEGGNSTHLNSSLYFASPSACYGPYTTCSLSPNNDQFYNHTLASHAVKRNCTDANKGAKVKLLTIQTKSSKHKVDLSWLENYIASRISCILC